MRGKEGVKGNTQVSGLNSVDGHCGRLRAINSLYPGIFSSLQCNYVTPPKQRWSLFPHL